MNDYPAMITPLNHVEPVPRRVRAVLDGHTVLDTTRALYVWEWENYPQYYIPLRDVAPTSWSRGCHTAQPEGGGRAVRPSRRTNPSAPCREGPGGILGRRT